MNSVNGHWLLLVGSEWDDDCTVGTSQKEICDEMISSVGWWKKQESGKEYFWCRECQILLTRRARLQLSLECFEALV